MSEEKYICTNSQCDDRGAEFPPTFLGGTVGNYTCAKCKQPVVAAATLIKSEVDQLLASKGLTRDAIENRAPDLNDPMAILQEANGTATVPPVVNAATATAGVSAPSAGIPFKASPKAAPTPAIDNDPGPDWADKLGEEYKNAHSAAAEISPDEFPEYPAQLIKALCRENNKISKEDVYSVIAEFQMNVSLGEIAAEADAIVVTDSSQKAIMKQARELRLRLRKERLRIEQVRVEIKEPYLRRTQLIDGVGKFIRDLFQEKEKHLQAQEDFEKLENERIALDKQAERVLELTRFEFQPTMEDLQNNRFGWMNDTEWNAFRKMIETDFTQRKADEAKQAEERRMIEQAAQIENDRTKRLVALGLKFDGRLFKLGEIEIDLENVKPATDSAFEKLLTDVKPAIDDHIAREDAAAALAIRKQSRIDYLAAIGIVWNGTEYVYDGYQLKLATNNLFLDESDEAAFDTAFQQWSADIKADKAAKAAADEENARLAKEKADQEAEAERLRIAPDKDKLLALADTIEKVKMPVVDSSIVPFIGQVEADLGSLVDKIRDYVAAL